MEKAKAKSTKSVYFWGIKNPFKPGDKKVLHHLVDESDIAAFETGIVHPFYATFALGRDAEWATRQFVLEMKEDDEEGIGTFLNIEHHSPALLGDTVTFTATIDEIEGHSIICNYVAEVNGRKIASGKTGQKILKKEKLERIVDKITNGWAQTHRYHQ